MSVLPLPGKIVKKLVHSRVMEHLEELHLLSDNQVGCRQSHSMIESVAKVTDDIFEGINKKQITVAALVNFKKAFDTINHKIFASETRNQWVTLIWLENYPTNRCKQTMANEVIF